MKSTYLSKLVLITFLTGVFYSMNSPSAQAGDAEKELRDIKEQFGPVLKLEGLARKEINAIAKAQSGTRAGEPPK